MQFSVIPRTFRFIEKEVWSLWRGWSLCEECYRPILIPTDRSILIWMNIFDQLCFQCSFFFFFLLFFCKSLGTSIYDKKTQRQSKMIMDKLSARYELTFLFASEDPVLFYTQSSPISPNVLFLFWFVLFLFCVFFFFFFYLSFLLFCLWFFRLLSWSLLLLVFVGMMRLAFFLFYTGRIFYSFIYSFISVFNF